MDKGFAQDTHLIQRCRTSESCQVHLFSSNGNNGFFVFGAYLGRRAYLTSIKNAPTSRNPCHHFLTNAAQLCILGTSDSTV
ncbi:hypothetical protein KCU88_g344, partial [Aureobasidium melanogenum]